jgi:hypothetical protein
MDNSNPYAPPQFDLGLHGKDGSLRPIHWVGVGTILSGIHFAYARCVALLIYMQPGDFTWVNLAWSPGSLLLARFGSLLGSPLMALGFWLHPLGSIAAGVLTMRAIRALGARECRRTTMGKMLLAAALWVVWTPVPFRGTFFYWFEYY